MAPVVRVQTLDEAIDRLDREGKLRAGTVIITDFDNTLVSLGEQARSLGKLQPDAIPDETMYLVDRLVARGIRIGVATNRPDEGLFLATKWAQLRGGYNVFPKALERKGVEVFGGGPLFMVEKFKTTDQAVYDIKSWLMASVEDGGAGLNEASPALVICIGDRIGDLEFFEKLEESVRTHNPAVEFEFYKLPGIKEEETPGPPANLKEWLIRVFAKLLP